jgi:hypothetical protein
MEGVIPEDPLRLAVRTSTDAKGDHSGAVDGDGAALCANALVMLLDVTLIVSIG